MAKGKWMQETFSHNKGKLHRRLGVPEGQKIPESKLESAANSRDPSLRKEVVLAKTGKRFAGKRHKRMASRSSAR